MIGGKIATTGPIAGGIIAPFNCCQQPLQVTEENPIEVQPVPLAEGNHLPAIIPATEGVFDLLSRDLRPLMASLQSACGPSPSSAVDQTTAGEQQSIFDARARCLQLPAGDGSFQDHLYTGCSLASVVAATRCMITLWIERRNLNYFGFGMSLDHCNSYESCCANPNFLESRNVSAWDKKAS